MANFAIRLELLKEAFQDLECSRLMASAKSWDEIMLILEAFAKSRGYKVQRLKQ